jgi:hypothetical protein
LLCFARNDRNFDPERPVVATLAERPDLRGGVFGPETQPAVPEFMRHDAAAPAVAKWRTWTGLPFDKTGPSIVPGALSPVHVSLEQDHAVYVEPNLWVHHRLS